MDHRLENPLIQKSLEPNYLLGEILSTPSTLPPTRRVYRQGQKSETLQLQAASHLPEWTKEERDGWEQTVRSFTQSPSPMLCSKVDHVIRPEFHWVISEFAGETSLLELAQSPKGLKLDEIEAFVRLLSTACESAVHVAWPQLDLDPASIDLNAKLGLPRLPYPQLEALRVTGPSHVDTYTHALASLCARLLGATNLDASTLSKLPRLTSKQRRVLEMALEEVDFPLEEFLLEFFDPHETTQNQWIAETLWNVTAKLPKLSVTERDRLLHPPTKHVYSDQVSPLPVFLPNAEAEVTERSKYGWMKVRQEDRSKVTDGQETPKLRLTPLNEDTPVLGLTTQPKISIGRASMYCDFVTQFRPRSDINDSRTLKISRHQAQAEWRRNALFFKDTQPTNPSTYQFEAVPKDGLLLKLPLQLSLAGEYPLEVLHLPSDFTKPPSIEGFPTQERPDTRGALVYRACGAGVYMTETCLVFSDITLHFSASGKAWFKGASDWDHAFARIHRWGGQFWLEALQSKTVYWMDPTAQEIQLNEVIHLTPGRKLKFGTYTYVVEEYRLEDLP